MNNQIRDFAEVMREHEAELMEEGRKEIAARDAVWAAMTEEQKANWIKAVEDKYEDVPDGNMPDEENTCDNCGCPIDIDEELCEDCISEEEGE